MLEAMGKADEQLKREQLKLSRNSKFRYVADCGHNVHITRPDVVAEEIKWDLSNLMIVKIEKNRSLRSIKIVCSDFQMCCDALLRLVTLCHTKKSIVKSTRKTTFTAKTSNLI